MVSGGRHILNTIKPIIKYDIPTASNTSLRAKIEMTTEEPDSNLIVIFKNRVSSSKLSDVLEEFENIIVNNNDIKEL